MTLLTVDVSQDGHGGGATDLLQRVLPFAFERLDDAPVGEWTVAVRLAGPEEISRLHAQFFNDPSDTDVMSFPSGDLAAAGSGYLGDIAISLATAANQAREHNHSLEREIVFLALHGLLHLLGHDDGTEPERQAMISLQTRFLADFDGSGEADS